MRTCAFEKYIKNDWNLRYKFASLPPKKQSGMNDCYYKLRAKYRNNDKRIKEEICRALLRTQEFEELKTFKEIAGALGISETSVFKLYWSAINKLKAHLEHLGYSELDFMRLF